MGVSQIRGTLLGDPIIRIIVYWGLYRGPPILGNYHIRSGQGLGLGVKHSAPNALYIYIYVYPEPLYPGPSTVSPSTLSNTHLLSAKPKGSVFRETRSCVCQWKGSGVGVPLASV